MKRSVLINLICSMVVTVILIVGVLLTLVFTGKLDTEKQKLVISSASHTVIYDGKTLTDSRWTLIEGELKQNHTLSVNVTGSQTNVGMSENYVSAIIRNESGDDVTREYTIEYRPGALQVKARELTILAESAMKMYDGTPLVCDAYILQSSVALLPTDELHVTVEGSITEIGEAVNQVTAATVSSKVTGEDVTRNYSILSRNGRLVIYDENALVLRSKPDSKVYDGTPLMCPEYEIINGELKDGHYIVAGNFASITKCGNIENTFEVKILDDAGNDVTEMYDLITDFGTLSVTQASVSITGNDLTGTYGTSGFVADGEGAYEVSGLPEGHSLVAKTDANGTPLGISGEVPAFWGSANEDNRIPMKIDPSQFEVLNADGEIVTDNFQLSATDGTLGVLPPSGTVTYFRVKAESQIDNILYLKQRSYGEYDVTTNTWKAAPEYSFEGSGLSSAYYLTRSSFLAGGLTDAYADRVEIDPV